MKITPFFKKMVFELLCSVLGTPEQKGYYKNLKWNPISDDNLYL